MKDEYTKQWIIRHSITICSAYEPGVLTLRALHYQLVGEGMTNDIQHYKRVVSAMIDARWDGLIDFEQFSDLDRAMIGETQYEITDLEEKVSVAQEEIKNWMTIYGKNIWENQDYYVEVLIEKKALQGVFQPICRKWKVGLGACKGYPSLTFLHELSQRFKTVRDQTDKQLVIIYAGDYDPSGEDIPRSIQENLERFGVEVDIRRIALMEHQVRQWNLPPAPAKLTDSRTANWEGLGQVELDAVRPERLQELVEKAMADLFDYQKYTELQKVEREERRIYIAKLRAFVNDIKTEDE